MALCINEEEVEIQRLNKEDPISRSDPDFWQLFQNNQQNMILAYLEEGRKFIGLYDAQKERTILKVEGVTALLYRMVIDSETSEEKKRMPFLQQQRASRS